MTLVAKNLARVSAGIAETAERNARAPRGGDSPLAGTVYVGDRQKMPKRMQKGAGVSHCWQCGSQLMRAPGRGLGLFYFHMVKGRDGIDHRVHGDCLRPALDDGCKFVPEPLVSLPVNGT